jgi:hypothetical protein
VEKNVHACIIVYSDFDLVYSDVTHFWCFVINLQVINTYVCSKFGCPGFHIVTRVQKRNT